VTLSPWQQRGNAAVVVTLPALIVVLGWQTLDWNLGPAAQIAGSIEELIEGQQLQQAIDAEAQTRDQLIDEMRRQVADLAAGGLSQALEARR
jgi:hypothetical protein